MRSCLFWLCRKANAQNPERHRRAFCCIISPIAFHVLSLLPLPEESRPIAFRSVCLLLGMNFFFDKYVHQSGLFLFVCNLTQKNKKILVLQRMLIASVCLFVLSPPAQTAQPIILKFSDIMVTDPVPVLN